VDDILFDQLRLEQKYDELIQLLHARLTRIDLDPVRKAMYLCNLAFTQLVAGAAAGAKVIDEQAREIFEPLYREKPDDLGLMVQLSSIYALSGEKDLALKLAERTVMLKPRAKDAASGPSYEENLAVIQMLVGENSRAVSTLTQLLQTPYFGACYGGTPITPAHLRLDPMWNPLRSDPAFQKLCQEK
jgi:hypothetical protein